MRSLFTKARPVAIGPVNHREVFEFLKPKAWGRGSRELRAMTLLVIDRKIVIVNNADEAPPACTDDGTVLSDGSRTFVLAERLDRERLGEQLALITRTHHFRFPNDLRAHGVTKI